MAVVQISRIQIRRGEAGSGTGLPQLASGEMAWALDTQQLFIGNGAVSEGAPAVGNTRVLTVNDFVGYSSLLASSQYTYKVNDSTIITGTGANFPVVRTYQQRLDDTATTASFGVVADGVTDTTVSLQRAINELFLNASQPANTYSGSGEFATGTANAVLRRVPLIIPSGIYYTTSTIYIPSYSTLTGAGADKTIIYYNPTSTHTGSTTNNSTTVLLPSATANMVNGLISGTNLNSGTTIVSVNPGVSVVVSSAATATGSNITFTITLAGPAVQFVNDTSSIGAPSSINTTQSTNQPRNIMLSGITIHSISGVNTCLQLDAVRDSTFTDLILQGDWANLFNARCTGIAMNTLSSLVTCEHNTFKNITFNNFSYGVYAPGDIINNIFEDCHFNNNYLSVSLGAGSNGVSTGQQYGPRQTQLLNSKFYNIKEQAVYLERGYSNTVSNCKFVNVGNNGAGNTGATYPQVYFKTFGNTGSNNYSDRALGTVGTDGLLTTNLTTPYIPEQAGHGVYRSFGSAQLPLGYATSSMLLFRLPVSTDNIGTPSGSINYTIDYFYQSSAYNFTRKGVLSIAANLGSAPYAHATIQVSDEYDFAGTDPGDSNAVLLSFTATFLNATGTTFTSGGGSVPYSIAVNFTNTLTGGNGNDTGYFDFSYSSTQ